MQKLVAKKESFKPYLSPNLQTLHLLRKKEDCILCWDTAYGLPLSSSRTPDVLLITAFGTLVSLPPLFPSLCHPLKRHNYTQIFDVDLYVP